VYEEEYVQVIRGGFEAHLEDLNRRNESRSVDNGIDVGNRKEESDDVGESDTSDDENAADDSDRCETVWRECLLA
jgi:hypothetical protein